MTDILVFPKMFEFYKFFSYFYKSSKYLVLDCKKVDEKEYLFKVVSLQPELGKSEPDSDFEMLSNVSTLGLSAQPAKQRRKKNRKTLVQSSLLDVSTPGRSTQAEEER
jgi:hypothetical protein